MKKQPFYKGIINKVYVVQPKKPNSALRKCCDVKLSNGSIKKAFIPGEGHNLTKYSTVLIKHGKTKDLIGFNYKVIRGKYDCNSVPRISSRSKYGHPKN